MNVSDARRRSTSSATTRSLSLFSKESPPKTIAPAEGGHDLEGRGRGMPRPYSRPPRLDFRPLRGRQLSLATGVSADSLRRGFGPFLLLGNALGSLGIDVNAGAHRARERDRADVPALRRGRLGADDLLDDGGVVLEQLPLVEALLPDRQVDVGAAIGAVLELPRLRVATALATSNVTVPALGFGILPRGPRMRPSFPTVPIMSGVATATSKSSNPSSICLARSAEPTTSAPASCASFAFSPSAKTAIRVSLPVPCGSMSVPRSCCSAWRTLRPMFMCTSTVSSNLAPSWSLRSLIASRGEYARSRSTFASAWR